MSFKKKVSKELCKNVSYEDVVTILGMFTTLVDSVLDSDVLDEIEADFATDDSLYTLALLSLTFEGMFRDYGCLKDYKKMKERVILDLIELNKGDKNLVPDIKTMFGNGDPWGCVPVEDDNDDDYDFDIDEDEEYVADDFDDDFFDSDFEEVSDDIDDDDNIDVEDIFDIDDDFDEDKDIFDDSDIDDYTFFTSDTDEDTSDYFGSFEIVLDTDDNIDTNEVDTTKYPDGLIESLESAKCNLEAMGLEVETPMDSSTSKEPKETKDTEETKGAKKKRSRKKKDKDIKITTSKEDSKEIGDMFATFIGDKVQDDSTSKSAKKSIGQNGDPFENVDIDLSIFSNCIESEDDTNED